MGSIIKALGSQIQMPGKRRIPKQNAELIRLISGRWQYAFWAQQKWAEKAKKAYDYVEGRQWTDYQLAKMMQQGRVPLTLNKIAPLIRLVAGYQANNRTDIKFLPGNDGYSSEQIALILSNLAKHESNRNALTWTDAEVFLDGIIGGRGWYDQRLDFEKNDFGEMKITSVDPFSVYPDPENQSYDVNEGAFLMTSRWASIDDIEFTYGPDVADLVRPFVSIGAQSWSGFLIDTTNEITPVRSFSQEEQPQDTWYRDLFQNYLLDSQRKTLRVIDTQYKVVEWGKVFIDMETGDKKPIPVDWGEEKIAKALYHAERVNNPLTIDYRPIKRVRWTVMVGDCIVHDCWSPYDTYTLTPYFPYFRRGITRGMTEDLIDPQDEINKRRSTQVEVITKSGNSGWMYPKGSLDQDGKVNIQQFGAMPGVNVEYIPTQNGGKPERIAPGEYPESIARLEEKGKEDLREIAGINESALGELDAVQSGRAIEARQRQAVISLQMYLDNFDRTKEMQGNKFLEIFQGFYNEPRIYRIMGEDSKQTMMAINQPDEMNPASRLNDIAVGKYSVSIDKTPLSASFANAQFEEALTILEKLGPVAGMLLQTRPDLLIEMSSLPRKEEWVAALQQALGMQAAAQAQAAVAGNPAAGASGVPTPPSGPGGQPAVSGAMPSAMPQEG